MKRTNYTAPKATAIKLYELMQHITVISGVADEDSLAPRFNDTNLNNTDLWQNPFEETLWQ